MPYFTFDMSATTWVLTGSFAEALGEMFHELASLPPDPGLGIWSAKEVIFSQVEFEALIFGSAGTELERYSILWSFISVG